MLGALWTRNTPGGLLVDLNSSASNVGCCLGVLGGVLSSLPCLCICLPFPPHLALLSMDSASFLCIQVAGLTLICKLRGIRRAGSSDKGEIIASYWFLWLFHDPEALKECLFTGRIRHCSPVWLPRTAAGRGCSGWLQGGSGALAGSREGHGYRRHPQPYFLLCLPYMRVLNWNFARVPAPPTLFLFPCLGSPFPISLAPGIPAPV